jgi:diaminopimelate epimerase
MVPFRKMHGLGNDFIVFDARTRPLVLRAEGARALADRRTGIGADTIAIIEPPGEHDADIFVRFINSDGCASSTCGNATRCIASLLFAETGRDRVRIATGAGLLDAWDESGVVAVDMGRPALDWRDIPLSGPTDTLHLPIAGPLVDPVGVSMGNPHAVFFINDAEAIDLAALGPVIERDRLFPERTNVEIATVVAPTRIRMRVWERGAGITPACGSGACATLVAAARRGLTGRKATLLLDGGELLIEWRDDDHVVMTGPAETSFTGEVDERFFQAAERRAQAA